MNCALATRPTSALRAPTRKVASRKSVAPRAISEVNLVIGGATVASLALGRFVFTPQQRMASAKAGLPTQNGKTHKDAGDRLAEEASFALTTNDPAGFNAVDTLAWGAIGHALGYFTLATNSLSAAGFDAKPF